MKPQIKIEGSVGEGATNRELDILAVQYYLNLIFFAGYNEFGVELDQSGRLDQKTKETMLGFQILHLAASSSEAIDRVIRPGGATVTAMNDVLAKIHHSRDRDIALLLNGFRLDKHSKDARHFRILSDLKWFLIDSLLKKRALEDRYWKFSYIDEWGHQRDATENHSLHGIIRPEYMRSAVEEFRGRVKGLETSEAIGKSFLGFEAAFTVTAVLICRFFNFQGGTGDAGTEHFANEQKYLAELVRKTEQTVPESIYKIYSREYLSTKAVHGG